MSKNTERGTYCKIMIYRPNTTRNQSALSKQVYLIENL